MSKIENDKVILNSLAEAVVTVDKNFKITFINEAAEKITGYKKDQIVDGLCKNYFVSDFCEFNCPIAHVLKSGKNVYDRETEIHCNQKGNIPIKLNAAVLRDENNEPVGGVISFRDITAFKEIDKLLKSHSSYYGIIGKDKKIKKIFNLIDEIADSDAPVIITGETGTGKELIANAIQSVSKRKNKPFVKVNCSAIPQNLLNSELFGHVKGAFTDARNDRIGRFEFANEGTIFLDEICDLAIEIQPQLLRFLQEGTFERLGESFTRKADVRVITATNKNIEEEISKGRFREDLFYRLEVININLPSLRERKEDIPLLIEFFINKYSRIYNKNILGIDDNTNNILMNYNYPGNIRELENIIEYGVIRTKAGEEICICNLPQKLRSNFNCNQKLNELEIHNNDIIELLNKYRWNKTKVAEVLGIDRTTLWRKMKSLGIEN